MKVKCMSLLITGVLAIGARASWADPRVELACVRADPRLRIGFMPGCSGWSRLGSIPYWTSYNSLGLRDRDYSAHGRAIRILVLGSQMFGAGLPEDESPPRRLEKELRARGMAGAEVINGGIYSYLAPQSSIELPRLLEAYSPDIVIYQGLAWGAFFNDLYFRQFYREGDRGAPGERIAGYPHLPRWLPRALDALAPGLTPWLGPLDHEWFRIRSTWGIGLGHFHSIEEQFLAISRATRDCLIYMNRISREKGARFYVVWEPSPDVSFLEERKIALRALNDLALDLVVPAAWVRQMLREAGIEALELGPEFDADGYGTLLIHEGMNDGFTRNAALKFAEAIAKDLLQRP